MHKHGGLPAVMVAPYSRDPDRLLLVNNLRAPTPCWKFIGEEMKPGETPHDTVIRALWEEGGFWVANPDDPEMCISEVRPAITIQGATPHVQYFFKVRLPYKRLRDLADKSFSGAEPDEYFKTDIFSFDDVGRMQDFFKPHRTLFKAFLGFTTA
jgi:ADP-ribose pyrophosphatase YjhB (NUDIX family)